MESGPKKSLCYNGTNIWTYDTLDATVVLSTLKGIGGFLMAPIKLPSLLMVNDSAIADFLGMAMWNKLVSINIRS